MLISTPVQGAMFESSHALPEEEMYYSLPPDEDNQPKKPDIEFTYQAATVSHEKDGQPSSLQIGGQCIDSLQDIHP